MLMSTCQQIKCQIFNFSIVPHNNVKWIVIVIKVINYKIILHNFSRNYCALCRVYVKLTKCTSILRHVYIWLILKNILYNNFGVYPNSNLIDLIANVKLKCQIQKTFVCENGVKGISRCKYDFNSILRVILSLWLFSVILFCMQALLFS